MNAKIVAFVGTRDATRARAFYRDTLGLKMVEESPFAQVFDVNGVMLRVTNVPELNPAKFTVLGWDVPDIAASVKQFVSAGIVFARYPGLEQDADGVWTAPSGAKIAWFQDPDGNTLSLTEF